MMTDFAPEQLATLEPETLADLWGEADEQVHEAEVYRHAILTAIEAKMVENRQEVVAGTNAAGTFKADTEWDRVALMSVKEHMSPVEWDALLTNPSPPERKPDLRKIKQLAKRGDPFRTIIEQAQRPGIPRLKMTRLAETE